MIPRITFLLAWVHDTLNYTLYKMFLTQRENFLSLPVPIKKINSPVKLQESFNKTRNFSAFSVLTSMLEAAAADLLVAGSIISNFCGFVVQQEATIQFIPYYPYLYKNNYWKCVFYIFSVHGTIYWFYLNIHYSYITFKQKFVEFTIRWTDYSYIFLIVYKCFLNILVSEDRMQTEEMVMWEQWSSVGGDTFICSHTSCFWEHSQYRYKL